MSRENSVEVEFVTPESEITLEGNCVTDSTGSFKVLTLLDEVQGEGVDTSVPSRSDRTSRRKVKK